MKRIILLCAFTFLVAARLAAQDPSQETFRGFNTYNSYQLGSFESVNEDNFNLIVHIPIVSYPQIGTLPAYAVTVGLQATSWYVKYVTLPGGGDYAQWTPVGNYVHGPYIYSSYDYSMGQRKYEYPGYPTYYDYFIQGPDLSVHNLGTTSINGNITSWAIDGSGWSTSSGGPRDQNGIMYGSGTDPSGNSFGHAGPCSSGSGECITDSVGRQIPVPSWPSEIGGGYPTPGTYTLSYPGLNGGTYPVTYLFSNYSISTSFNEQYENEYSKTVTLLQSITLPNGTQWSFNYNNFGDVSSITTPTGGTVSYSWALQCFADPAGSCAHFVSSRTINANDGNGTKTWTYGSVSPGGSGGTTYPGFIDPDGNITAYTTRLGLPGACGFGSIATTKNYYQFTASGQPQTLLKTVYTNYSYGSSPYEDDCPGATNVLPQYTTTTFPNGQTTSVKQTTYGYDSGATFYDANFSPSYVWPNGTKNSYPLVYGSLLQKQETDYGPGNPGSLLTDTVTTPEWTVNPQYLTTGMIARPSSVTIYDSTSNTCEGQSNPCAQTHYAYDETGNGSLCATLPCGNLTSETHWLNTGNSPKTQYVYNSQGMRTKKCDPIDPTCQNPTSYTYDPSGMFLSKIQYPSTGTTNQNHIEYFNYDLNTGLLNWQKDENLQETSYGYDSMLRIKSVSYPDTGSVALSYNDSTPKPSFTVTQTATPDPSIERTGIVDGFGRKTETELNSDPAGPVLTDFAYDNEGRLYRTWNPTRCSTAQTNCGESTWGYATTTYDALNRATSVVEQDGSSVVTDYSHFPCTTVTDEAGKQRKTCVDGLGRLAQVVEDPWQWANCVLPVAGVQVKEAIDASRACL